VVHELKEKTKYAVNGNVISVMLRIRDTKLLLKITVYLRDAHPTGFNSTTTTLIIESAAREGSPGHVEGFTGNGFIR